MKSSCAELLSNLWFLDWRVRIFFYNLASFFAVNFPSQDALQKLIFLVITYFPCPVQFNQSSISCIPKIVQARLIHIDQILLDAGLVKLTAYI